MPSDPRNQLLNLKILKCVLMWCIWNAPVNGIYWTLVTHHAIFREMGASKQHEQPIQTRVVECIWNSHFSMEFSGCQWRVTIHHAIFTQLAKCEQARSTKSLPIWQMASLSCATNAFGNTHPYLFNEVFSIFLMSSHKLSKALFISSDQPLKPLHGLR